jgi:hypothetical protein
MSRLCASFLGMGILCSGIVAAAQRPTSENKPEACTPAAHGHVAKTSETDLPPAPHPFFDRQNVLLFSGVAVFRGLDYASTRNMQARGREEILLPDDVVNNSAAFAAVEAGGTLASVGISYILHRTGHHKLERWMSIGHMGVTAFGVARNYSLKSLHP